MVVAHEESADELLAEVPEPPAAEVPADVENPPQSDAEPVTEADPVEEPESPAPDGQSDDAAA
jgi:hypothetical protein